MIVVKWFFRAVVVLSMILLWAEASSQLQDWKEAIGYSKPFEWLSIAILIVLTIILLTVGYILTNSDSVTGIRD